jgi:hypothetical protein
MPLRTSLRGKNPPLDGGGADATAVCAAKARMETSTIPSAASVNAAWPADGRISFNQVFTSIRVQPGRQRRATRCVLHSQPAGFGTSLPNAASVGEERNERRS